MEGKLDLARVHKKLAEAQFFLGKMTEQDRRMFLGDGEIFDYYLSAFLNAGRTVDYRLRHEQAAIYPAWQAAWDAGLTPQENSLIKFMVDDRIAEVHKSGSNRSDAREEIGNPMGSTSVILNTSVILSDTSSSPVITPAVILKPTYNFTIDGAERKATEACTAYLALLQRMVTQFEADHP